MQKLWPLLLLTFCQPKDHTETLLKAHERYMGRFSSAQNLTTLAHCQGPEGPYTTATEGSLAGDYLLFRQDYSGGKNPFYAVIYSRTEGYGLDTALQNDGPLSEPTIGVLKAHEFHEMALQARERFTDLIPAGDTAYFETNCKQLTARDLWGNDVRLYFHRKHLRLEGFSLYNPYKKGELIAVHFTDWQSRDSLRLFFGVTVLQGKNEYTFDYRQVEFDHPDFQAVKVN